MKKTIAIAIILIATTGIYKAQDYSEDVHLGLKAGLNYSNVYDSKGEEFEAESKVGIAFGAFVAIPIGDNIGLQPEVLFSQKGFEANGKVLGLNYNFKRTTSYLDIPLYFAIIPAEFLTIFVGPQFSYLISKKDEFTSDFVSIEQEEEFENENFRKNTLGAALGLDINIDHFVLGVRANWDLQENKGDGTSSTPRYKNQWLQATVGVRF
jgi:hypothetical protein